MFETFKNLYSKLNCMFSVSCFSETWATDNSIQIENYTILHQVRASDRGGALRILVRKEVYFKSRSNLSINSNGVESLCIKIHYKKEKNTLFSVIYSPPNGDMTVFEVLKKLAFSK